MFKKLDDEETIMKKAKIAIIGPFNNRGGREIEVAFIADSLSTVYDVTAYSTEFMEKDNDISLVNPSLTVYSKFQPLSSKIKTLLGKSIRYDKVYLKKNDSRSVLELEKVIVDVDLVFILAQLTSAHTKKIISLAKKYLKPVLFRTTGTITQRDIHHPSFDYLEDVNLFINHSESNSIFFKERPSIFYKVIDQCVFNEEFINTSIEPINQITQFYAASRLDKNKDIVTIIRAFNSISSHSHLQLHVIGDGPEMNQLQKIAQHNTNIKFYGHLEHNAMMEVISHLDCLIISSREESGPYNALEAMILGLPIISTRVGAMTSRFTNEDSIWFDAQDWKALAHKVLEFSSYDQNTIVQIQKRNNEIYQTYHLKETIAKAYLDAVSLYI